MPELPELEVVQQVLQRRAVGATIEEVSILPPGGAIVVRDLTHRGFVATLTGATIAAVARRGKFLIFSITLPDALQAAALPRHQSQTDRSFAARRAR